MDSSDYNYRIKLIKALIEDKDTDYLLSQFKYGTDYSGLREEVPAIKDSLKEPAVTALVDWLSANLLRFPAGSDHIINFVHDIAMLNATLFTACIYNKIRDELDSQKYSETYSDTSAIALDRTHLSLSFYKVSLNVKSADPAPANGDYTIFYFGEAVLLVFLPDKSSYQLNCTVKLRLILGRRYEPVTTIPNSIYSPTIKVTASFLPHVALPPEVADTRGHDVLGFTDSQLLVAKDFTKAWLYNSIKKECQKYAQNFANEWAKKHGKIDLELWGVTAL